MFHNCTEKRVVKTTEKNTRKNYILFTILFLITSVVHAETLQYDNGNTNYAKLAISSTDSARVRFTPTADGNLTYIQLYWRSCQSCPSSAGAHFDIRISGEGYERAVTLSNIMPTLDAIQNISVDNFDVQASQDFYVTVEKTDDTSGCLCLALADDSDPKDRSYAYDGETWYSLENTTGNWQYPKMDIIMRAQINPPTTTTTLAYRGGGGGGTGGGIIISFGNGSCFDGLKNQDETGVDCGGSCAPCPSCSDGIQNQGEIGVDCGGPCAACTTTTLPTSTTVTEPTTTTTQLTTSTLAESKPPVVTGFVTGLSSGGLNITITLVFLLLIVVYLLRGKIFGGAT